MSKNIVNPYELDLLADSIHTIPPTTFKSNPIQVYNSTFTFESVITKANVPVGKGVTVYIYHKGLGTLLSKTETDSESKIYVPNLSKHNQYMVVAVDPTDIYNSVIFDINFDFNAKLKNDAALKYYSIYDVPNLQQLYTYWDTTADQRVDPSILFFISNPAFKDDLSLLWGITGTIKIDTIKNVKTYTFSNSGESIYLHHNPVPPKSAFTFSAYIYINSNNRNTTTNNNIFKQHTQSFYIDANLKLNYKNTDSSNSVELVSDTNVIVDEWNLVSISYDGSKFYLFLNGILQQSVSNSGGMSYADSTFTIGDSFKGYITQPLMNDVCKYTEDFDFLLKAFSYKTNVYSDPTDTFAEYVRVKLSSDRLTYGLRDEVNNIAFSSGLENKYFTPLNTRARMIATTNQQPTLILGTKDFCMEFKLKFKSTTGYPRIISNNNDIWTTNCWEFDVNRSDSLNVYSLHVYNIGSWVFTYPVIFNELVDLALVREGINLKLYVNGFLDKTINIGTGSFDNNSVNSFLSLAGSMSVNFYDFKFTVGNSRYTSNYTPKQLQWVDNDLAIDQYKIINLPFKQYTMDNQSVLSFTNTNLSLSTDESINGTKSAYFNTSKIVSNSKLFITNEKFTIEMFYKPKVESLTGVVSLISILNSFRLGTNEGFLSFFNGTAWENSTYLLDDTKFHHIVIQRTGTTIKLLADGNLVLTTTYTVPVGLKTITIGCFNDTEYVNGYVNNFIMYKNITKFEDSYTVPTEEIIVKPPEDTVPEVIVTQFTTAALDFEDGLVDKIPTTTWVKKGTAGVTSSNQIFKNNSFETKALGDSLYTNSSIITGGPTPFTIEFYSLIKSLEQTTMSSYINIITGDNLDYSSNGQGVYIHRDNKTIVYYRYNPDNLDVHSKVKILFNEINKITISYDGACIRVFINNVLASTIGTLKGFIKRDFIAFYKSQGDSAQGQINGLLDNVNIFDGEARVVRDYDEYADKLIVDLSFDGENNSAKIVDNGTLRTNWSNTANILLSTSQPFNGFSSLFLNKNGGLLCDTQPLSNTDIATISFEVIPKQQTNNVYYDTYDGNYDGGFEILQYGSQLGIWYSSQFESSGISLDVDQLYKVTFIYNAGFCKLYINGILTINKVLNINFKTKFAIGAQFIYANPTYYSYAYLKNFKIYKGVEVIPESPVGKIQLDFDNNVKDKYNNSTWTNNSVTFDQVNSIKGYSAKFNGSNSTLVSSSTDLDFDQNDFQLEYDISLTSSNSAYSLTNNTSSTAAGSIWFGVNGQSLWLDFVGKPLIEMGIKSTIALNTYYNQKCFRINDSLHLKYNDVITSTCLIPGQKFNLVSGGSAILGGSTAQFGRASSINGNIDNFKSIKNNVEANIIDRPAVHLPLESNVINTGFTALTVNSVGGSTYTTIDGKKCIKFESGRYLTINSNNIFNLGTSSDFYLEMDVYIEQEISLRNLITNSSQTNGIYLIDGRCYVLFNNSYSVISDNTCSLNKWTKIIIKRIGSTVSLNYDSVVKTMSSINAFDLSSDTRLSYNANGAVQHITNFKMFVGTSEIPETYNDKKVLDLDFKPTRKSYLFKDNNNKCIIHPVNIVQRDYLNSRYCCTFNGSAQYLQLGKNDLLNFDSDDFILHIVFSVNSFTNIHQRLITDNEYSSGAFNYMMITGTNYSLVDKRQCIFFGIEDSSTSYMFSTTKVELNAIYDVKIVRNGNVFSMYVNDVLENTFTSSKVCNFNRNNNTIIGGGSPDNPTSSTVQNQRYQGTIYSVKVLRNTTDLTLLEDKKPEVIVAPDERGAWIIDTATWSSASKPYSIGNFMLIDPTLVDTPVWNILHRNTIDFSIKTYKSATVGPVEITDTTVRTINKSPINKKFYVHASNGTWSYTSIDAKLEFLDSDDNIIMVMKWEKDDTYRHGIWYGTSWSTLTKAPQSGSYPQTYGVLDFRLDGLNFYKNSSSTAGLNTNFIFNPPSYLSIAKIRVTKLAANQDYTGGSSSAFFNMYLAADMSLEKTTEPLIDLYSPGVLTQDVGLSRIIWSSSALGKTDSISFKGELENTSANDAYDFYKGEFTLDVVVNGSGDIFTQWQTNLRYSYNLSSSGIVTFKFYMNTVLQTVQFDLGMVVTTPTQLTLIKDPSGFVKLYVNGNQHVNVAGPFTGTYYNIPSEKVVIGSDTLNIYDFKLRKGVSKFIEKLL